jgi:site-specific DNA recombinase
MEGDFFMNNKMDEVLTGTTGKIYNDVFYGRVSTTLEGQAESCENQLKLCKDFIKNNKNHILVKEFIDDGISGKSDERKEYLKMIAYIYKNDIDYIITKSLSRLCRSSEVNGGLNRALRETNTKLICLENNQEYNPFDKNQVFINSIMAAVNEQYVYNQSDNGKIAHLQKCMEKRLNAQNNCFGYKWNKVTKQMEIVENEADIIRNIFDMYVYQDMGVKEIGVKLASNFNVYGKVNNNILTPAQITNYLENPAYYGQLPFNKKKNILGVGSGAKTTRVNIPKEEWVYVDVPPIIDKELWDMAQTIRYERRHIYDTLSKEATQSYFKGFHKYSGGIVKCGSCGSVYRFGYTDRKHEFPLYYDTFSKKMKKSLDEQCNNQAYKKIYERTLDGITKNAYNLVIENNNEVLENLKEIINGVVKDSFNKSSFNDMERELEKLKKEKDKILNLWYETEYNDIRKMLEDRKKEVDAKISNLENTLNAGNNKEKQNKLLEKQLKTIATRIDELKHIGTVEQIDKKFIDNMVDSIEINEDGRLYITLKLGYKLTTQLQPFEVEKEAIRNGLPTIHIIIPNFYKTWQEVLFFGKSVGKMFKLGTTAPSPQDTQIPQRIC